MPLHQNFEVGNYLVKWRDLYLSKHLVTHASIARFLHQDRILLTSYICVLISIWTQATFDIDTSLHML